MNYAKINSRNTAEISGLVQWDKGQELTIEIALDLTDCSIYWAYPHLSTLDPPQETEKREITLTKDGDNHPTGGTCTIPNNALVEAGEITGYIYHESGGTGETIAVITANVSPADRPEDYVSDDYIPTVVEVVNDAIDSKLPHADTLNNITADDNGNPLYDGKPLGGAAIIVDAVANLPPNAPDGSAAIVRYIYTKSDLKPIKTSGEDENGINRILKSLYFNPKILPPNFTELGISNVSVTAYLGQFGVALSEGGIPLTPRTTHAIIYTPADGTTPANFLFADVAGANVYICYIQSYTVGDITLTGEKWYLITGVTNDIPSMFEEKYPVLPDAIYFAFFDTSEGRPNTYKLFESVISDIPYVNVWYDKINGVWVRRC